MTWPVARSIARNRTSRSDKPRRIASSVIGTSSLIGASRVNELLQREHGPIEGGGRVQPPRVCDVRRELVERAHRHERREGGGVAGDELGGPRVAGGRPFLGRRCERRYEVRAPLDQGREGILEGRRGRRHLGIREL